MSLHNTIQSYPHVAKVAEILKLAGLDRYDAVCKLAKALGEEPPLPTDSISDWEHHTLPIWELNAKK